MHTERLSSRRTGIARREFIRTTAVATAALGFAPVADWSSMAAMENSRSETSNSVRLWYDRPAVNWNEALPLGNGRIGAMVFGGTGRERLQLNEETIWTGEPDKEADYHCDGPKALPEIRRLTFADKWSEAQALFGKAMIDRWFAKYQPMSDLWLEFPGHEDARSYRRNLHLDEATSEKEPASLRPPKRSHKFDGAAPLRSRTDRRTSLAATPTRMRTETL